MKIIIVGAGTVGYSLIEQLSSEGHNISLVEIDESKCRLIREKMDILVIGGTGSSPVVLEDAGVKEADMIIAVTDIDEVNILVCTLAYHYGVKKRVARIRSREYLNHKGTVDLSTLGVTRIIDLERVVVDNILQYIDTPGATDAANFQDGKILMRGYIIKPSMPIANKNLKEISELAGDASLLVVSIIRKDVTITPTGNNILMPDDRVLFLFPRSSLDTFLSLVNCQQKSIKRVVVSGDNLMSIQLTVALEQMVENVILLDPNREHSKHAAEVLNSADVLLGDCTEMDILKEIHLEDADFFIATTNNAKDNIMSALLAKREGVKTVLAVTTDPRYSDILHSIGIDHVINPYLSTAREIMEVVHRGQIDSVVQIRNSSIEAIRIMAGKDSKITGAPLHMVWKNLQEDAIVGTIIKNGKMIIPSGNTVIEDGDNVIVVTQKESIGKIQKLFKPKSGIAL
jgi:trk system potassium uptake protein TrkA